VEAQLEAERQQTQQELRHHQIEAQRVRELDAQRAGAFPGASADARAATGPVQAHPAKRQPLRHSLPVAVFECGHPENWGHVLHKAFLIYIYIQLHGKLDFIWGVRKEHCSTPGSGCICSCTLLPSTGFVKLPGRGPEAGVRV
jgi:hypothetical protein